MKCGKISSACISGWPKQFFLIGLHACKDYSGLFCYSILHVGYEIISTPRKYSYEDFVDAHQIRLDMKYHTILLYFSLIICLSLYTKDNAEKNSFSCL